MSIYLETYGRRYRKRMTHPQPSRNKSISKDVSQHQRDSTGEKKSKKQSLFHWKCVWVQLLVTTAKVTQTLLKLIWKLRPPCSSHSQLFLPSSVSPGTSPEDGGAKRSVSEEGHPLGVALGTNAAVTLPLFYPSAGFGRLLPTAAQTWPRFSKHACTAARPLYTRTFFKYCQEQLNSWLEQIRFFSMLESRMVYLWRKKSPSLRLCSHHCISGTPPHHHHHYHHSPQNGAVDTFTMKGQ